VVVCQAVCACGNEREGDAFTAETVCQSQRVFVAGTESIPFPMRTIDPDRPNSMDDVFCIQGKGRGVNGLTRCNVAYLFPRGDQLLFTRSGINGTVGTPTDPGLRICGIYDGVSLYLCYIISDDLKGHTHHLSRYLSSKNVAASSATWIIHASGYCSYASLTSRTVPAFPSEKPIWQLIAAASSGVSFMKY